RSPRITGGCTSSRAAPGRTNSTCGPGWNPGERGFREGACRHRHGARSGSGEGEWRTEGTHLCATHERLAREARAAGFRIVAFGDALPAFAPLGDPARGLSRGQ